MSKTFKKTKIETVDRSEVVETSARQLLMKVAGKIRSLEKKIAFFDAFNLEVLRASICQTTVEETDIFRLSKAFNIKA